MPLVVRVAASHTPDAESLPRWKASIVIAFVSSKIVTLSDVAVLDSDGREVLTLVTCHPFYFVGAAPDRFIVRAERI